MVSGHMRSFKHSNKLLKIGFEESKIQEKKTNIRNDLLFKVEEGV